MLDYKSIHMEIQDRICILTLNNPEKRNPLSQEMRNEILHALEYVENQPQIKAIILTGSGKAFSAGGDLNALKEIKPLEGRKRLQGSHGLVLKMLEIEKPIITAVNGAAAGAGFSLVLLSDLTIASEDAFFVQSFVNVGLIPDYAALNFLPAIVGPKKAKELIYTGDRIKVEEALNLGIVNHVVPTEELLSEAKKFAEKLAEKSSVAIGMSKQVMNNYLYKDLKVLLEMEAQAQDICFQSPDFKEGVQAFFEKRKPNFE